MTQAPEWSEQYNVGLPAVDDEHRGLFAAASDLADAMLRQDWRTAQDVLALLPADMTKHFGHEERLMRRAGYIGYDWHRRQHTTARKRILILTESARREGLQSCDHVIAFLRDWLPYHINLHDRMMTASVRNFQRSLPQNRPFDYWRRIASAPLQDAAAGGRRKKRRR